MELDVINNQPINNKNNKNNCGTCTACCTIFAITELGKPNHVDCIHLSGHNKGCSIYDNRPGQCRRFECEWLKGSIHNKKLAYRPDRLGLVFTIITHGPLIGIVGIFKVNKDNLTVSAKARSLLRQLERKILFYFNDTLYGPSDLIEKWKEKHVKS
jgi:hypothetical protein